ncbi:MULTISPECIES: hypothetical protein [Helicobacter]|uniref:hypothetical protein n=1 Tax=Helicobacter TaxID=209 RepID=UPI0001A28B83|nr:MULTISPECIES: hypothetical protein [Helicobacter]
MCYVGFKILQQVVMLSVAKYLIWNPKKKIFRAYALARAKILPTLANMTRILDSMGLMYKKSSY